MESETNISKHFKQFDGLTWLTLIPTYSATDYATGIKYILYVGVIPRHTSQEASKSTVATDSVHTEHLSWLSTTFHDLLWCVFHDFHDLVRCIEGLAL